MQTTKNRRSRSGSGVNRRHSFSHSKPQRGRFKDGRPSRHHSNPHRGTRHNRAARKMPTFNPSQFINTNPVAATPEIYTPKNSFSTFGVSKQLVYTITSLGMKNPTPIQDQIIPKILEGHDVIGLAETGTGKTAAFLIPLIEKTLHNRDRKTLILAPTRELAIQIEGEFRKLSHGLKLFSALCVGGISTLPQIKALNRSHHFVIGTPGRVSDLIKNKHFKPGRVTTVVLDEADRMLDMGFIGDMRAIISKTPKTRETLFFSATIDDNTRKLVHDFLRDPTTVSVKKKDVTDSIEQNVVLYEQHTKFETLISLLKDQEFNRVLIFGSMKHSVEKLARQLSKNGIAAESIHGNKNHRQRQRALSKFKNGEARILVATDVAARGIHVENVSHVINYDLPHSFEDYVHRIGRTGRAEKKGKALTFIPTPVGYKQRTP